MYTQNLIKFQLLFHKILSGNKILTTIKGHNSAVSLQKLTRNNSNLDLVKVYAYAKFDPILLIYSQDIEQKRNVDNNQGP